MDAPEPSLCESVCDVVYVVLCDVVYESVCDVVYVVYRVAVGLQTAGASELRRQDSTYENWKSGRWG